MSGGQALEGQGGGEEERERLSLPVHSCRHELYGTFSQALSPLQCLLTFK